MQGKTMASLCPKSEINNCTLPECTSEPRQRLLPAQVPEEYDTIVNSMGHLLAENESKQILPISIDYQCATYWQCAANLWWKSYEDGKLEEYELVTTPDELNALIDTLYPKTEANSVYSLVISREFSVCNHEMVEYLKEDDEDETEEDECDHYCKYGNMSREDWEEWQEECRHAYEWEWQKLDDVTW